MRDLFQEITDRIAGQLASGTRPWAQPWRNGVAPLALSMPHNVAGRPYRGANVFWLWAEAEAKGYARPAWLTFKQALEAGGAVRKGEKATPVLFWKFDQVQDDASGEISKRVMVRQYSVFNVEQCDGLQLDELQPKTLTEPERIDAAEAMIAATGARIVFGGDRAFYTPTRDFIQLPERAAFKSADGFYSTAFHELGHWTGHTARLGREYGRKFGDEAYAFEELVAELCAAFVCASNGFANIEREDHAAYLQSWLKVLKGDSRAFITAASHAQRAADLVMGTKFAREAEDQAQPLAA